MSLFSVLFSLNANFHASDLLDSFTRKSSFFLRVAMKKVPLKQFFENIS